VEGGFGRPGAQASTPHDVIGEQNLGGLVWDGPPGVALHVAGVFGEADRKTAAGALLVAFRNFFRASTCEFTSAFMG